MALMAGRRMRNAIHLSETSTSYAKPLQCRNYTRAGGARCTVAAGVEHAAAMQLLHATAALPPRRRWVACAASRSAEKQPIDGAWS